jgi:hypothetical protein
MEGLDRIESSEALDACLEQLRQVGGTPADFEVAVKELAARVEGPMSHRAVLRIARVGVTSFNGHADVSGEEFPEFQGRPWVDLPRVSRRTDGGGPRRERLPDEALHDYVGYLGEELLTHLGVGEEVVGTPFGQAAAGYVSTLAIPELRRKVGWERSVDVHALGMLTAERALRHLGEVGMSAEQEEACFRWLHLATYDEVAPEHVDEVLARRTVRLEHAQRPPGAVAVMTCEVPVEDALWFQETMTAFPTRALSPDQLRAILEGAADSDDADRARVWSVRREGFGYLGRIDLTMAAASEGPDHGTFVHGHLMRWIVEEEIPFRPHLIGLTAGYAASIHRNLVLWPAEKGEDAKAVVGHARAMRFVREGGGSIPLADELVLLAWLMDQRGIGVRLAGYLDARDKSLSAKRGQ